MRLTTKGEYSLPALVYMARRMDKEFVKIEDICAKYGLSIHSINVCLAYPRFIRYTMVKYRKRGEVWQKPKANLINLRG